MLCKPSSEQEHIITKLKGKNIVVDSVAGSGKTYTNIFIAKKYYRSKILLLTYNKKLSEETKLKIKNFNIKNIDVFTYHGFCTKYYGNLCESDIKLYDLLINKKKPIIPINYNIIILDEIQDLTPLYYDILCKSILCNENKNFRLCLLGDKYQSIYRYKGADNKYIENSDKEFNLNNFKWENCSLSETYRVPKEVCDFINVCMLKKNRIYSHKITNHKPRYIICNRFKFTSLLEEIQFYLNNGYKNNDIFILSPSMKHIITRTLANLLSEHNIPIFVPNNDDDIDFDDDILKNKILFSSFHQSKGLEKKVAIILCFDSFYFLSYNRNHDPLVCCNELYVATTRCSERLSLIHHSQNDFLQFLDKEQLCNYCDMVTTEEINLKIREPYDDKKIAVTQLIKHLPFDILNKCLIYIKKTTIRPKIINPILINKKSKQKYGYEIVNDIIGTAIPALFQYILNHDMIIYERIFETSQIKYINKIKHIDMNNIKISDLLLIANVFNTLYSNYDFKLTQIDNYKNICDLATIKKCITHLKSLNISEDATFELSKNLNYNGKVTIYGSIDCLDKKNIYEFKCTSDIKDEHILQLAIYMYLNKKKIKENIIKKSLSIYEINDKVNFTHNNKIKTGIIHKIKNGDYIIKNKKNKIYIKKNNIIDNITKFKNLYKNRNKFNYYIYNILNNELIQINCSLKNLEKIINILVNNKNVC